MEIIIDASRPIPLHSRVAEYRGHGTLLKHLIFKDWNVRYRNAGMGFIWAMAQPMLPALILGFLFSRTLAPQGGAGVPYALFLLAGFVPWGFLSMAVTVGSGAFVNNSSILTKVYFPRGILPFASVLAATPEFAGGCLVVGIWTVGAGLPPQLTWLWTPILFAAAGLLALVVSLGIASLNVLYKDVRHAIPFLLQVWMYSTPVIYSPLLLPEQWRWVLGLNPMTGIVLGFRSAWFGAPLDLNLVMMSAGAALVTAVAGIVTFAKLEKVLAERV